MTTHTAPAATCSPEGRVTRSLLGYGVIAGPVYVLVSLAQAATRDGFDLRKHAWSLLSNGSLGWLQITNFILVGLMVGAFAAGVRRASGGKAAPVLFGIFAASQVAAGLFRADPALGFPPGTPDGPGSVTSRPVPRTAPAPSPGTAWPTWPPARSASPASPRRAS